MTETASLISLNHPFSAAQGSVGKILPGREFKLADDGEILVRGENVSSGYWQKGSLQQSSEENNGWLRTGDLGELDSNGNLKFRGRKKNVIVTSAGLNIHPEDLEAALKKQRAIRDAVVVPINRGQNAEPCAVLLENVQRAVIPPTAPLLAGSEARNLSSMPTSSAHLADRQSSSFTSAMSSTSLNSAIIAANTTLADYQQIRTWFIWPEPDFPRTPTGKPRLATIAARAGELLNVALGFSSTSSSSGTTQIDQLAKFLSSTSSTSLASLSSLDRVELLSALEHRYNIEINESAFSQANSVADLQKIIAQPASQQSAATKKSDAYNYPRWTQREPIRLARLIIYYTLVWPATQLLAHPRVVGRHHLQNRGLRPANGFSQNAGPINSGIFWLPRSSTFSCSQNFPASAKASASPANPPTAATPSLFFPKVWSTTPTTAAWPHFNPASACWQKISRFPSSPCAWTASGK